MKGKRILALALIVVLILGVFPVSVSASEFEIHVNCPHCDQQYTLSMNWEDYHEGIAEDWVDFLIDSGQILECGCCHRCSEETHCAECGECFYQEWLCPECNCCWTCLDEETHCPECSEHTELCEDCLDVGVYRCRDCHDDRRRCPGCGTCVEALAHSGELCCGYNDSTPHCTECHEDWVCDDCGQCFYDFRDAFCVSCGLCIDCAVDDGLHCWACLECSAEIGDLCDATDLCLPCCASAGYHCVYCFEHVDEWCTGGFGSHCAECAWESGWICESCERCEVCDGFDFCKECELCTDCCLENSQDEGCECGLCVLSAEFESETHRCRQCESALACAVGDFCEDCGFCEDCCMENSVDAGCECGLCVRSSDFAEHICEACGEPVCMHGDFCDDCGRCMDCCLEESENQGCECGMCTECSDFEDHICPDCGEFACTKDFCETCGLCVDCCEALSEDAGCEHGVCIESLDWDEHYCAECGHCREDEKCTLPCCTGYETDICGCCAACTGNWHCTCDCPDCIYSEHAYQIKEEVSHIREQPSDQHVRVQDSDIRRAKDLQRFSVATAGSGVRYRWYQDREGVVTALDNQTVTTAGGISLTLCSGVDTDTLYIAVPKDACHVSYRYFCVISDSEGRELSRSREAAMEVAHNIQWIDCGDGKHERGCIGEGCTERYAETAEAHRLGPETTLVFATATETGLAAKRCRICGAYAETRVLPKLVEHTAHSYRWEPVLTTDYNSDSAEIESPGHIYRCACGDSPFSMQPHSFGEWEIIEPATEKKAGRKTRTCLVCGWEDEVVIEKKYHHHTAELDYDEIDIVHSDDFRKLKSDAKGHWQLCTDPECNQATDYEMHRWSDWLLVVSPTNEEGGEAQRYCTVCGWYESKYITPGVEPLIGKNVKTSLKQVGSSRRVTLEAKPPVGYEFLYWVNNSNEKEEHFIIQELKDGARPTEPKMTFRIGPDHNRNYDEYGRQTTLNPVLIEAKCARKDNVIVFYSGGGKTEFARLWPGEKLFADGTVLDTDRTDYVAYYASQTQSADRNDDRVATLCLKGYDYGPIELDDTGLPCELRIAVEDDSRITLGAGDGVTDGILGCASGGSIRISSENGSVLSVNLTGMDGELCGIRTRAKDTREETDVFLEGSVRLQMKLGQEGGSGVPEGAAAIGISCPGYLTVKDDADVDIILYSMDDGNLCRTPMQGIKSKHEMQIDTTGHIRIDAYDAAEDFKAAGINAPDVVVNRVGELRISVPKGKSKAVAASIRYDRQKYVFVSRTVPDVCSLTTGESRGVTEWQLRDGYSVQMRIFGASVAAEDQYVDEEGNFLVQKGDSITFTVTPESGKYLNERSLSVLHSGASEMPDTAETSDGISYTFRYTPTESVTINGEARDFRPFADLTPMEQTILPGEEITVRVKVFDETICQIESRAKRSAKATGQRVSLQYFDPVLGWVNSRYTFALDSLGQCTFRDPGRLSADGTAEQYRFAILIDGEEYTSDVFTVTRSENSEDLSRAVAQEVDVYVRNAGIDYSKDGGNWIRLDRYRPYLLVYTATGVFYASREEMPDSAVCAVFRAGTGTLELYGDSSPNADAANGIAAIRTPAGSVGDLKIRLSGNVTMEMDYDSYSYFDEYGTGSFVNNREGLNAETAAITNMGGSVSVQSAKDCLLSLTVKGTEGLHYEDMLAAGLELVGIRASGNVKIGGKAGLWIGGEAYRGMIAKGAIAFAGIVSGETIAASDSARIRVSFSNTERGGAQGLRAAKNVLLEKNSDTQIDVSAQKTLNVLANCVLQSAIEAQNVRMTGSAGLTVSASGDLLYGIRAESVVFDTDSDISIRVPARTTQPGVSSYSYALFTDTAELRGCRSLSLRYIEVTDPDFGGAASSGLSFDENSFAYYVNSNADTDIESESRWVAGQVCHVSAALPDGAEGGFGYRIRTVSETLTEGAGTEPLPVRRGDRVTLRAPEARTGYTFTGWETEGARPADWSEEDGSVSFTMPGADMTLIPTYRATLFTVKPAFALNRDDPQSGRLFWSAAENGSSVLYYSLQGRSSDGSWSDYYDDLRFSSIYDAWMLNDNAEYVFDEANDLWRVFGTEPLTGNFFGGTGRFIDVFHDVSRFRICAHCGGSGTGEYRIYSEEFTLDGLTGGESYGVWVGGMPVTSGNCGDVLGDGTVSYEPVSRTLTLNNAGLYDLFCRYWETDDLDAAYGIFSEHDLNLRLIGRSEIRPGPASAAYDFRSIPRMAEDEYAYYTLDVIGLGTENGNITVIGPGRLDILSEEYGVICEGDFTLRSGSLCICSGDSSAVSVWDGSFDMSGGALTLESPGCDGISLNHDKEAGSTVSFRGGTAVVSAKYDCIWLGDDNDTVRFSGGTLSLFRTDPSGGACASERNMEYNRNGTLVEVAGSDRILQVWDEAKPLSAYATVCFTAKAQPAALTGRLVGKDSILICVDAAAPGQTECRVLLAEYDRKGKMVSIQQKILSVGSETAETEFRVSQDGYLWKCMLTDENVIPMCSGVLMR